jgi:glycine dehydrogenase subunit 1
LQTDGLEHQYLALSKRDREEMMAFLGIETVDTLFSDVPMVSHFEDAALNRSPAEEPEVYREVRDLSKRNLTCADAPCFLPGSPRIHYIPAAVQVLAGRGEFLTSYTPYQPEISQGVLQALFEYQSMVSELTALDVVNASHYTYGTSLGEAALMAHRTNSRRKIVVCGAVDPERLEVLRTYASGKSLIIKETPFDASSGRVNLEAALSEIDQDTSLVYLESPNYFGIVDEQAPELSQEAHSKGALFCQGFDLVSLALYAPPGELGADIAVGEGVGYPPMYGGPSLGVFATRKEYVRNIPGRLVGMTSDAHGKRGYVITLQTREQHIRREKATSNITTNSAVLAIACAVYLSLLGYSGLRRVALKVHENALLAAQELAKVPGARLRLSGHFYQDFVMTLPYEDDRISRSLAGHGILGPLPLPAFYGLPHSWLFGTNELMTHEHLERLMTAIREAGTP